MLSKKIQHYNKSYWTGENQPNRIFLVGWEKLFKISPPSSHFLPASHNSNFSLRQSCSRCLTQSSRTTTMTRIRSSPTKLSKLPASRLLYQSPSKNKSTIRTLKTPRTKYLRTTRKAGRNQTSVRFIPTTKTGNPSVSGKKTTQTICTPPGSPTISAKTCTLKKYLTTTKTYHTSASEKNLSAAFSSSCPCPSSLDTCQVKSTLTHPNGSLTPTSFSRFTPSTENASQNSKQNLSGNEPSLSPDSETDLSSASLPTVTPSIFTSTPPRNWSTSEKASSESSASDPKENKPFSPASQKNSTSIISRQDPPLTPAPHPLDQEQKIIHPPHLKNQRRKRRNDEQEDVDQIAIMMQNLLNGGMAGNKRMIDYLVTCSKK